MAAELQATARPFKKRKPPHRKGKNTNKKLKPREATAKKPTKQMQKLFKRRANEYHSSDEEESDAEPAVGAGDPNATVPLDQDDDLAASSEGEGPDPGARDEDGASDDSEGEGDGAEVLHGITKFSEGCRAFKLAFLKIIKKKLSNDPLGPILSAHKNLVIEKLAEEVASKGNSETKKEKHLAQEKGHVKPASYLDAREKLLISIATKGVVKLFNAVNKAQNSQKGLDPSKSKDAKVLVKRRKQTFLSELKKSTAEAIDSPSSFNGSKGLRSTNGEKDDEPGWAPLRDSYMLTSSKLKNWDKMPDSALDDHDRVPLDSSSDEE